MEEERSNWMFEPLRIGIGIFAIVISLLVLTKINTTAQASATWSTEAKGVLSSALSSLTTAFNYGFLILIIVGVIGMIYVAKKQNLNVYERIVVAMGFVFVAMLLMIPAQVYDNAKTSNSDILGVTQTLTFPDYIMGHLVQIGIIMFGLVVYFIFTSGSSEGT